ncbi:Cu-processing system ATP-binding protein [Paracidovorax wautersii]|uniref:Cu-processing system ATP-binding protein n=1 Tax=Paracidovorax wautersii TaxID=1177982 RepID=A0ABU1I7N9_9BURK|nr:Cu-processing system ATP-binding protein [Paracidovorax wautersii]
MNDSRNPCNPDAAPPGGGDDGAVRIRGVHKHYGAVHAVDGIDLDIGSGELFGLIGHNGAGKSTLFKMVLGLVAPTSGVIDVLGADVQGPGFRDARRHVGYLPENVVLYDNLSGLETLEFFARLKGVDRSHCAPALERVGLDGAGRRAVREYSKGMRQRLGFAQALLGMPRVLLLDEPTNGLDPAAIRGFYATLRELQAQGVTVVITSHILSELQERVDRIAILSEGRLQALGSVAMLREQAKMPLRIAVALSARGAEDSASLQQALQQLPSVAVVHEPPGLRLTCPREDKMAVLGLLARLGPQITDIDIHEPSLEDVFFGLPGRTAPTGDMACS